MNAITQEQLSTLRVRETDVDGAVRRMNGDEALYEKCLLAFLSDPTIEQLNKALRGAAWDDAFTAAHALKGVAGNMGFVPLMHNTGQLIIRIRCAKLDEIPTSLERVNSAYRDITDGIHQFFAFADDCNKE